MRLHATKKLYTKIPASLRAADHQSTQPEDPFGDWHGKLITVQRRQCVIVTHEATRYTLVLPCLTKPDFANLQTIMLDVLLNSLLKLDYPVAILEMAGSQLANQSFTVDSVCHRSAQGTVNRLAEEFDYSVWYHRMDITQIAGYAATADLANRPTSRKVNGKTEWLHPADDMRQWLELQFAQRPVHQSQYH